MSCGLRVGGQMWGTRSPDVSDESGNWAEIASHSVWSHGGRGRLASSHPFPDITNY